MSAVVVASSSSKTRRNRTGNVFSLQTFSLALLEVFEHRFSLLIFSPPRPKINKKSDFEKLQKMLTDRNFPPIFRLVGSGAPPPDPWVIETGCGGRRNEHHTAVVEDVFLFL